MSVPLSDLPHQLLEELLAMGVDTRKTYDDVAAAVEEDVPGEDVTSEATVPSDASDRADLEVRADGVVAGLAVAELVFRYVVGDAVEVTRHVPDGEQVTPGDVVMSVRGPVRSLLTAERTALNYLCHLSGVATTTSS